MKKRLLAILFLLCAVFFVKAQTADLMDVRFRASGEAKNLAATGTLTTPLAITTPGNVPLTIYEPTIKQFVSRFSRPGNTTTTYYKLDYSANQAFKDAVAGSFTLEAYIKATSDADMCAVSSQEGGGFGIEHNGNGAKKTQLYYNSTGSQVTPGNESVSNTGLYHHVVFVVSRNADNATIKAYYNGNENGSASVTTAYKVPNSALAYWIAIGGDASKLTDTPQPAQYPWNGDVAFTRMYSTALTPTEVQGLYNQVTARAALTKVSDLNTVIGTKLPAYISFTTDAGKKATAQTLLNEGWDLMGNLTATDTDIQTYLDKINTQLGSIEPEVSTLPVFAVISDTHVGSGNDWAVKLNRGIDQLIAQSPKLDAVFINGDVTDWGKQGQYTDAKNLFARLEDVVRVYYLMGNHDWFDSSDSGNKFTNTLGQPFNQYVVIKGYPFITISMERSTYPDAYTGPSQTFLTDKIAQAKTDCPGKPIFVFAHMPVTGTVYGSYEIGGGDNWGTGGLKAICEANSEVILFSGHSHYPLGDERSIHQDKFTSINDGSMTYSEIETGKSEGIHPPGAYDVTEGALVSVQSNGDVKVKRWDFTRKEEIKQPWLIKAPFTTASFTYKNRTGGTKPYFEATDKPTVNTITDNGCTVTFPQGKDDDLVHHYVVEVMDENDVVLSSPKYTVFSGFFLNSAQPTIKTWAIAGLSSSTKYKVRVSGVDSYGQVSNPPIISDQFTTNAYVVDPSAALATADLLDVRFKNGGTATDASAKNWPVTKGGSTTPSTAYDSTVKQYTNVGNGTSTQFFKVDYQNDGTFKSTLQTGFSLETYIKTTATTNITPVSSQQNGGFGVEQDNGGATKMWFATNSTGTYDKATFGTLTPGTYYHLLFTWDNTTKKMNTYVNGVPVTQDQTSTGLVFSTTAGAQYIGIGGDAFTDGVTVQTPFKGSIATTRMYGKALSRDEVVLAYQQIQNRAGLTKVGDLNTALINTIPNATTINQSQKDALLAQGWALMGDLATTDAQIETFLANLQTVLPITLTSFNAQVEGSQVKLNWTTSSEKNSSHFEILRSTDGKNFSKIGEVKAAGNTDAISYYHFTDFKPENGVNYYQLKQFDKNGDAHSLEKIATAKMLTGSTAISVANLSATSVLVNVYAPKTSSGKLTAVNVNGQKIGEQPIIIAEGNNKFELPLKAAKGLVVVTLTTDEGKLSKKIIR